MISSVGQRQPLRLAQLRQLVDRYAAGKMSLGLFDKAARAILRRPKEIPMIPLARAFYVAAILFAIGCGTPEAEPEPAHVAQSAAKGCRLLGTIDGLRCLPDTADIFWESDPPKRVLDFGESFTVDSPDPIRWIFFLTAGEPSTIRQIVLVPSDAWRDSATKIVVPHSLAEVTIPLDWFGSFFQ